MRSFQACDSAPAPVLLIVLDLAGQVGIWRLVLGHGDARAVRQRGSAVTTGVLIESAAARRRKVRRLSSPRK